MHLNAQQQPRFGYPTKRVPDPLRRHKKGISGHNELPSYTYRETARGKLRLYRLHATKGWRQV